MTELRSYRHSKLAPQVMIIWNLGTSRALRLLQSLFGFFLTKKKNGLVEKKTHLIVIIVELFLCFIFVNIKSGFIIIWKIK